MAPRDTDLPLAVLRKFPTNRDKSNITVEDWLLGREADDGAEGLWRIHNDLYDLTTFVTKHPGGRDWIELTRGTDITEVFEIHHVRENAQKLLPKFHVRAAKNPRLSLVTFKEDGFYKTLKRRVQGKINESGPTLQSKFLADGFALSCLILAILGARLGPIYSILSGIILHMLIVTSHNFFHMKDNWRMYYFNFSLMSYRDWRVSHVLSHHIFPNTMLDLEISMWEPFFQYLPHPSKSFTTRFLPWVISPFMFITMFHYQFARRVADVVISRKLSFRAEELICLGFPLSIFLLSGAGLWASFMSWNYVILSASFVFGVVGLTAAHHHPEIFHEGDASLEDKDFGLLQMSAVRDRIDVNSSFFLVMIAFGDHTLHHLFPTIDHHRLPALYPIFIQTCKEFGIEFKLFTAAEMFAGMYQQLARNYRNAKVMIAQHKNTQNKPK